jgi:uncharacterized protein
VSFFLILFSLFFVGDVIWGVWADVRLRAARVAWGWRALSGGFIAACALSLVWWLAARRLDMGPPPSVLMSLTMVWHLFVLPAAIIALLAWGILKGGVWGWRRVLSSEPLSGRDESAQPEPSSETADDSSAVSRRRFLGAAAATAPMVLAFGATGVGYYQLRDFRVRRLVVPIASLPQRLDGMTIAHVSDTHVGRFTRGRILQDIARTTNTLNDGKPCDLVLFTGDLINDSNRDLDPAIAMSLKFQGRHGAYLVEGNHDLIDDGAVFDRQLREAGLNLLNNETQHVEVNGQAVQIVGLRWGPPQRVADRRQMGGDEALLASLESVQPRLDRQAFKILLAHHPHALDYASQAGIPLTFSGHTHGGQLMLSESLGPGPLMYRYWSGLYHTPTGAAGVVSNGVGNWFPLRINAPAEIIHVTLRRHPV